MCLISFSLCCCCRPAASLWPPPAASGCNVFAFLFFFFVFPSEVMAATPSIIQTTPLTPPTVYCHFCNLPDTLEKKGKKTQNKNPPFAPRAQRPACCVLCFSRCVRLESFIPPQGGRHASRSQPVNALPLQPCTTDKGCPQAPPPPRPSPLPLAPPV